MTMLTPMHPEQLPLTLQKLRSSKLSLIVATEIRVLILVLRILVPVLVPLLHVLFAYYY